MLPCSNDMDPLSRMTAKVTSNNRSKLSKQFRAHLISKGLYKYIAEKDVLVNPTQQARRGTVALTAISTIDLTTDAATTEYPA